MLLLCPGISELVPRARRFTCSRVSRFNDDDTRGVRFSVLLAFPLNPCRPTVNLHFLQFKHEKVSSILSIRRTLKGHILLQTTWLTKGIATAIRRLCDPGKKVDKILHLLLRGPTQFKTGHSKSTKTRINQYSFGDRIRKQHLRIERFYEKNLLCVLWGINV